MRRKLTNSILFELYEFIESEYTKDELKYWRESHSLLSVADILDGADLPDGDYEIDGNFIIYIDNSTQSPSVIFKLYRVDNGEYMGYHRMCIFDGYPAGHSYYLACRNWNEDLVDEIFESIGYIGK